MEIQSTTTNNVAFRAQLQKPQEKQEVKTTTTPIKNDNKKLSNVLLALGALGAAGIGIAIAVKKGKASKATQEVSEALNKTTKKAAQEASETAAKTVEKAAEEIGGTAKKGAKKIALTSKKATQTLEQSGNKAVQEEIAKASTPASIASQRHIEQQNLNDLLTGQKANKSAKNSAAVFEEAFNKTEQENAQKALEAATGKKSRIVADESYQKMYADLLKEQEAQNLDKLLTGKKANLSAKQAASAFSQEPIEISEKIADVCSYKGIDFTPNRKIEQRLRKMNPKALEQLSHRDVMRLLETPSQPKATKVAINKLLQFERSFTK